MFCVRLEELYSIALLKQRNLINVILTGLQSVYFRVLLSKYLFTLLLWVTVTFGVRFGTECLVRLNLIHGCIITCESKILFYVLASFNTRTLSRQIVTKTYILNSSDSSINCLKCTYIIMCIFYDLYLQWQHVAVVLCFTASSVLACELRPEFSPFLWNNSANVCTKELCQVYDYLKCDIAR